LIILWEVFWKGERFAMGWVRQVLNNTDLALRLVLV
jgi:hypothetical protein